MCRHKRVCCSGVFVQKNDIRCCFIVWLFSVVVLVLLWLFSEIHVCASGRMEISTMPYNFFKMVV